MRKLNYKQGDIIIVAGKTHLCRLATPERAIFTEWNFHYITSDTFITGGGCGMDGYSCSKAFIIDIEDPCCVSPATFKDGIPIRYTQQYPVIGFRTSEKCGRELWNMLAIRQNYPEIMKRIGARDFGVTETKEPIVLIAPKKKSRRFGGIKKKKK